MIKFSVDCVKQIYMNNLQVMKQPLIKGAACLIGKMVKQSTQEAGN